MREIKFRVWDKKAEKIIDAESVRNFGVFALNNSHSTTEFLLLPYPHSNYILMQYTGLKDNQDVEIYEGDVIKVWCGGTEQQDLYEVTSLEELYFDTNRDDGYLAISSFKLVGNIYENPELLKEY